MKEIYYLDWFLMLLNLYAYYLIGIKNKLGFIFGGIGCVAGIVLFYILNSIPMIIMYIAFGILNIINYYKWK